MTDIQNTTEKAAEFDAQAAEFEATQAAEKEAAAVAERGEVIKRVFTPDLAQRFDAIGIAGVERAIDIALQEGKTEDQVAAELKGDIEQLEGQQAERKAHAEAMEAAAKAEGRRIERLTTASIIFGHVYAAAEPATDRRWITDEAVRFADELIATIDAVEAPSA